MGCSPLRCPEGTGNRSHCEEASANSANLKVKFKVKLKAESNTYVKGQTEMKGLRCNCCGENGAVMLSWVLVVVKLLEGGQDRKWAM